MQFTSIVATALALAASATAIPQVAPTYTNGTGVTPATNSTGSITPSGTGSPSSSSSPSTSFVPSTGGASQLSTGAMGLLVVGGIAMAF
ncbi:Hypothetical predicted protein [Lecanosticta acicola]|uniref:Uncharacterized protein n=1 Tax=Lecanosticta acicola TaxID=111012 RepID=A0AAI9EAY3_9PEZI|nr:Hypothetical predicted protein [Lecanosticta acicola]